jgi:DNA-directed RNA polymerase subunit RPC12/RpoP
MRPICPDCQSKNILYKKRTNTYWCRRCGKEWGKKEIRGQKQNGGERQS